MAMGEGRTKDKMRNTKFKTEKNVYFHLINKTKIQTHDALLDVESVVEFSPTPMDGRDVPWMGTLSMDFIHDSPGVYFIPLRSRSPPFSIPLAHTTRGFSSTETGNRIHQWPQPSIDDPDPHSWISMYRNHPRVACNRTGLCPIFLSKYLVNRPGRFARRPESGREVRPTAKPLLCYNLLDDPVWGKKTWILQSGLEFLFLTLFIFLSHIFFSLLFISTGKDLGFLLLGGRYMVASTIVEPGYWQH